MNSSRIVAALCATALAQTTSAEAAGVSPQAEAAAPSVQSVNAPAPPAALPAGTLVELELLDPIASSRQHRGDTFRLRVAEPVLLDGLLLIPAGTTGSGEVVHAAPSGGGGKAGELIVAARSLDLRGRSVALRGMKLGGSGKDNSRIAVAVGAGIGPFAMFVHGREIEIPAGTRAHAKLATELSPTLVAIEAPAPAALPVSGASVGDATPMDSTSSPTPNPSHQE